MSRVTPVNQLGTDDSALLPNDVYFFAFDNATVVVNQFEIELFVKSIKYLTEKRTPQKKTVLMSPFLKRNMADYQGWRHIAWCGDSREFSFRHQAVAWRASEKEVLEILLAITGDEDPEYVREEVLNVSPFIP